MRFSKLMGWAVVAVGMIATGVKANAADFDHGRFERRDLRHDYARVEELRRDIRADQARLNEDLRCGRTFAARAEARDIARDRAALQAQYRDIHRDWR